MDWDGRKGSFILCKTGLGVRDIICVAGGENLLRGGRGIILVLGETGWVC